MAGEKHTQTGAVMKEALNVLIFLGESSLLSVSVLCLVKVKRVTGNFHRKVFFFKKLPSRGWRGERTKGSSRVQWAEQVSNGSPLVRSVFGLNYWHLCQVAGGGDPRKNIRPSLEFLRQRVQFLWRQLRGGLGLYIESCHEHWLFVEFMQFEVTSVWFCLVPIGVLRWVGIFEKQNK